MTSTVARHGLARVIARRGLCSRSTAEHWVREGRVRVDGRLVRDPERRTAAAARIEIDGVDAVAPERVYLALNKPRGLVTTAEDERGRDTVYRCFDGAPLPWIAPVGRLDRASEGLLLFSNDSAWAAAITAPASEVDKTYAVQIDRVGDEALCQALVEGQEIDGDSLRAKSARVLRAGGRNSWLEIVLDEGRNRHIRRLLGALEVNVLRLVRTAIGPVVLGTLPKGAWRPLTRVEREGLVPSRSGQGDAGPDR